MGLCCISNISAIARIIIVCFNAGTIVGMFCFANRFGPFVLQGRAAAMLRAATVAIRKTRVNMVIFTDLNAVFFVPRQACRVGQLSVLLFLRIGKLLAEVVAQGHPYRQQVTEWYVAELVIWSTDETPMIYKQKFASESQYQYRNKQ